MQTPEKSTFVDFGFGQVFLLVAVLVLLSPASPAFGQAYVTGTWPGDWQWTSCPPDFQCSIGTLYPNVDMVLTQKNSKVTGVAFTGNTNTLTGSVAGTAFTYRVDYQGTLGLYDLCNAQVLGNQLTGTCTAYYPKGVGSYTLSALEQSVQPTVTCLPTSGPTQVGAAYSASCTASGGTPPYAWNISSGVLPAGLALTPSAANATVSGTPTAQGSYHYRVLLTDSGAPPQTAAQVYTGDIVQTPGTCVDSNGQTVPLAYTVIPYVHPQKQLPDRCWATQGGIMLSWKDGRSIGGGTAAYIADKASPQVSTFETYFRNGDPAPSLSDYIDFLLRLKIIQGGTSVPTACEVSLRLQQQNGPMTVIVDTPDVKSVHAVVLTGISGDGTAGGSVVTIIDPDTGATTSEPLRLLLSQIAIASSLGWPEFVQF